MSRRSAPEPKTQPGAIARFGAKLNPAVISEIQRWIDHAELNVLRSNLNRHDTFKSFLDTYAEALVARRLVRRECDVRFEVPTPRGKACDFAVDRAGTRFYLHVKRLDTEQPVRRRLTVSSRLRILERIERPYIVSLRWLDGASDRDMQRLVHQAGEFIAQASVGDEMLVRGDDGGEIGGVLIVAPWEGSHVSLAIGLPTGFIDETLRFRRLLRRAYRQFMPRAENVILVCSSETDDAEDFRDALLGSHIERWDTHPPIGRRIAHGRANDGFWSGRRYIESRVAGWFRLTPGEDGIDVRLWLRDDMEIEPAVRDAIESVLT